VSIWVCGEVLIDILPSGPVVGGGPANTAKALARLGHDVHFIDGISTDSYGASARAELLNDGVNLDLALASDKPTCTATVTLDAAGGASYEFLIDGTATFDFNASWLPDPYRYQPQVLHIGTLVTVIEPGASALYDWAMQVAELAPIVFDPNIRPSVMPDRDLYEAAVEKWAALSAVIKVSDDDLAWLFPGQAIKDVANRWINDGAFLVVVTQGANGLMGYTSEGRVEVPGVKVDVVDTVGAGDTVGAIVVEAMLAHGLVELRGDLLRGVLTRAAAAAAITCSRKGAQPPFKHELPIIEAGK
jgi:fructokinase